MDRLASPPSLSRPMSGWHDASRCRGPQCARQGDESARPRGLTCAPATRRAGASASGSTSACGRSPRAASQGERSTSRRWRGDRWRGKASPSSSCTKLYLPAGGALPSQRPFAFVLQLPATRPASSSSCSSPSGRGIPVQSSEASTSAPTASCAADSLTRARREAPEPTGARTAGPGPSSCARALGAFKLAAETKKPPRLQASALRARKDSNLRPSVP
jgi:hypothetical protein